MTLGNTAASRARLTPALGAGLLLCGALAAGCDDGANKPSVTRDRNQVVLAKGSGGASKEPLSAGSSKVALGQASAGSASPRPPTKPKKRLCGGELKPGYALPDTKLPEVGDAAGAALVPSGKWVWLNFWAAWCEPCKEEIPRLLAWQKKLRQGGVKFAVTFITLDDDQRQLDAYMNSQPASGLRHSFWLKEGAPRESWLKAAKLDPDPNLPFHVLLDPKGEVRCVIDGAVEDADYADLAQLISG